VELVKPLRFVAETRTVQNLGDHYRNGQLNLAPGFQRSSVWRDRDRSKLIDSIFRGYPIPSLFLHKTYERGNVKYHVIDGKQRLETLLRFIGLIRGGRFAARVTLGDDSRPERIDWKTIQRREMQHRLLGYNLQIIFVEGEPSQVIDLFVRINSTGRALTPQETRNARYFRSEFLRKAARLADRMAPRLRQNRVLSANQISRMKHIELMSELMLSVHYGEVIHKKQVLDQAMSEKGLPPRAVAKAYERTQRALNRTFRMFPQLKETRFVQLSDFYTLVVLIYKLDREGFILNKPTWNKIAWCLLREFGAGVDQVREQYRHLEQIPRAEEVYTRYLRTVTEGTDRSENRKAREKILYAVLASQFAKKDRQRAFTPEQRRIIWNMNKERRCAICGKKLSWENFTIDHVKPHSKGGRTVILNAALMHRSCNAAKGNR